MTEVQTQKLQALRSYMQEIKDRENPESYLIGILHKVQDVYGYLPREMMDEVAQTLLIPTAHIWGVATFYHYFNLEPIGQHVISVCMGTACYVKGAAAVLETLKKELGVEVGQTTEDKLFTLQEARCLGACGIAPVIMIDEKIYGELDRKKTIDIINQYRRAGSVGKPK
ncbi:MAG TPA: NADH-quinone oxidoreductase subunit NuoE [Anaerohalosphaeraceae bacterium]|jgi:NADH:ubiquinone oxidoreductase subunit E|nr:NADH-quinone oxidoreductase subunit NuoE [Anaerohalosphaeraceae bacterium]